MASRCGTAGVGGVPVLPPGCRPRRGRIEGQVREHYEGIGLVEAFLAALVAAGEKQALELANGEAS